MAGRFNGRYGAARRIERQDREKRERERKINLSPRARRRVLFLCAAGHLPLACYLGVHIALLGLYHQGDLEFRLFCYANSDGERRDCDIRRSLVPKFGQNSTATMLHEA